MTIEESIQQAQRWVESRIEIISKIDDERFRRILFLSLIDAFAQNHSNFQKHNQKEFSDFLYIYASSRWPFLKYICPVTLFNYYSDRFQKNVLSIHLTNGRIYVADASEMKAEGERIRKFLLDQGIKDNDIQKHTYANLVYAMRNKLAHELTIPGSRIDLRYDASNKIPNVSQEHKQYYDASSKSFKITEANWNLHIPEQFLQDLLTESSSQYLNACRVNSIIPFSNHSYGRKFYFAWYD